MPPLRELDDAIIEGWRNASGSQRRWIYLNAVLGAAVLNVVLSALFAWLAAGGEGVERAKFISDSAGTFVILPLLTTIVLTSVIWAELRRRRLEPLPEAHAEALRARLPDTRPRRGALFAALSLLGLGVPILALLAVVGPSELSSGEFITMKAALGAGLGLFVTPPIAIAALAGPPTPPE